MNIKLMNGHVLDMLKNIPDERIDCIVSSCPYYGLRSYIGAETIWGGNPGCEHEWDAYKPSVDVTEFQRNRKGLNKSAEIIDGHQRTTTIAPSPIDKSSRTCLKCGAWKGQLGLEPSYDMYIDHLLIVMKELKRVLKKTGTLFWNMGDTYSGGGAGQKDTGKASYDGSDFRPFPVKSNLPNKSLMMIPERFAMAMIDDDSDDIYELRDDIPESIKHKIYEQLHIKERDKNEI